MGRVSLSSVRDAHPAVTCQRVWHVGFSYEIVMLHGGLVVCDKIAISGGYVDYKKGTNKVGTLNVGGDT